MPKPKPAPSRQEIIDKAKDGTLLAAMFADWGGYGFDDTNESVVALAKAHNSGDVDLVAIVTAPSLAALKESPDHHFFQGQQLYCALIPLLETDTEPMLRAVEALYVGAGADGASGLIFEPFSKWVAKVPARSHELVALADAGVAGADEFLTIAIKTGAAFDELLFTDRAYAYVETGNDRQRMAAINALGQIPIADAAGWTRLMEAFKAALDPDPGDEVRSVILTALGRRLKDAPTEIRPGLERVAMLACTPLGERTLHQVATMVGFDADNFEPAFVDALFDVALNVAGRNLGTLNLLDQGLSRLVRAGRADEARAFVEPLLLREHDPIKLSVFDSLRHELFQGDKSALVDWVVAWLLDGRPELCKALDRALFAAGTDEVKLTIDFSKFGISAADYVYLARKAIAAFFLKAELMASILVSLLRTAPALQAEKIEDLIAGPVLTNYSGVAAEYLKPVADDPNDAAGPRIARALAKLDAYLSGLQSIGQVPELHPSERERQLEYERHSDSMNEAMRAARKKSIFASLATEQVMLYGTRAITWVYWPGEEPRRIQTDMATIGHSFEIPRIDMVDPLGLQMMLLSFKLEKGPQ